MSTCSIAGCHNPLSPNSRLHTCATCRQSMHKLERKRTAEILVRGTALIKYQARLSTVAVVKDGEVTKVDRDVLEEECVMTFPKRKAKGKGKRGNVLTFKRRAGGAR
jgi:hypothetical protein